MASPCMVAHPALPLLSVQASASPPARLATGPSPTWWCLWTSRAPCAWRPRARSRPPRSGSSSTSLSTRPPPTTGRPGWVSKPGPGPGTGDGDWDRRNAVKVRWTQLFCSLLLQTVVTLENGKLVQKQCWDGKETNIEREISDGKLIAVSTCAADCRPLEKWI